MRQAENAARAGLAPRAGAWIETQTCSIVSPLPSSPPARGRGLKHDRHLELVPRHVSPPARGHGLGTLRLERFVLTRVNEWPGCRRLSERKAICFVLSGLSWPSSSRPRSPRQPSRIGEACGTLTAPRPMGEVCGTLTGRLSPGAPSAFRHGPSGELPVIPCVPCGALPPGSADASPDPALRGCFESPALTYPAPPGAAG